MKLPFLPPRSLTENAKLYPRCAQSSADRQGDGQRWNIIYFGPTFLPAYKFMGNKRIASVADMKGVKMRNLQSQAKALQVFGPYLRW